VNINEEYFFTKDLYLAAFVKAKGVRLVETVKQGNIATFGFERTDNLEELIKGYFEGTETVEAIKFVEAVKNLKNYIYNIKER